MLNPNTETLMIYNT